MPRTTVALKLINLDAGADDFACASSSRSSARSELDFQPQLWLTENTSGTLVNRVVEEPIELEQETEK